MSEEIVSLRIKSCLKNVAKVESLLEKLRVQFNINDTQYGNMMLASVEAVTNAIEHGNSLDAQKEVSIIARKSATSFRLIIKDQGNGFDPDGLPDPTKPEFKEQPDGRGVFLMRQLADEVAFSDGGRTVEMFFVVS